MPVTFNIDPVSRIEGHYKVHVVVDTAGDPAPGTVTYVECSSTLWRGFENILKRRDPRDAPIITQRICGVCPTGHGTASVEALENCFGITPPANGQVLRNISSLADFIMSHITHFYHLAALDYIDASPPYAIAPNVAMSPWAPQHQNVGGMIPPGIILGMPYSLRDQLVNNYITALAIRRKAHTLGAEVGGKHPCQNAQVPGGITTKPSTVNWANVVSLMNDIRVFIGTVYLPDLVTAALAFGGIPPILGNPAISGFAQGFGCGNTLSWGACPNPYNLGAAPYNILGMPLFAGGTVSCPGGVGTPVGWVGFSNPANVREQVLYSHYDNATTNLHPSVGKTTPLMKAGPPASYTWHKAPRYNGAPHEVGPLARMLATALAPAPYVAPTVNDSDIGLGMGATYQQFVPAGRPPLTGSSIECAANAGFIDHVGLIPALGGPVGPYTAGGLVTTVVGLIMTALFGGVLPNPLSYLFSTLGRHAARGLECKYIADAMGFGATGPGGATGGTVDPGLPMINAVVMDPGAGSDVYTYKVMPKSLSSGAGLTEAPRGALGHWVTTEFRKIVNYQCVVPSTWNACGRDDAGTMSPIEQTINGANIGDPVVNPDVSVNNILKLLHPYDFCIACSVHMVDTKGKDIAKFTMNTDGSITKHDVTEKS